MHTLPRETGPVTFSSRPGHRSTSPTLIVLRLYKEIQLGTDCQSLTLEKSSQDTSSTRVNTSVSIGFVFCCNDFGCAIFVFGHDTSSVVLEVEIHRRLPVLEPEHRKGSCNNFEGKFFIELPPFLQDLLFRVLG